MIRENQNQRRIRSFYDYVSVVVGAVLGLDAVASDINGVVHSRDRHLDVPHEGTAIGVIMKLLLCVTIPVMPVRYPVVESFGTDEWSASRVGPVAVVVGSDFKVEAEFRTTHWNLHWWVNGEYTNTTKLKELPKLSASLFGKE